MYRYYFLQPQYVLFLRLLFLLRHCAPIDVRNVRFLAHVDTELVSSNRPCSRGFPPKSKPIESKWNSFVSSIIRLVLVIVLFRLSLMPRKIVIVRIMYHGL